MFDGGRGQTYLARRPEVPAFWRSRKPGVSRRRPAARSASPK